MIYFSERSRAAVWRRMGTGRQLGATMQFEQKMAVSWSRVVEVEMRFRISFEVELVRPAEELDVGWEGEKRNYRWYLEFSSSPSKT